MMVRPAWPLLVLLLPLVLGQKAEKEKIQRFWEDNMCEDLWRHPVLSLLLKTTETIKFVTEFLLKIRSADLRDTDIFENFWELYPQGRVGPYESNKNALPVSVIRYWLYSVGYMNYVSIWNNETSKATYRIPGRKGSVEETALFLIGKMEQLLEQEIEENTQNTLSGKRLASKLEQIEARLGHLPGFNETGLNSRNSHELFDYNGFRLFYEKEYRKVADLLEEGFKESAVQEFLTRDSRQEFHDWAVDNLSNVLKNMAFFGRYKTHSSPKAADNVQYGLPGGHDPLTFIFLTPKVLQSPKVEPVLRMTMAKFIAEKENFDGEFFRYTSCFLLRFSKTSILRPYLGLNHMDVALFLEKLSHNQDKFASKIQFRDPEPWIDLMDAIIKEAEKIDIDQVFYDIYVIALKGKHYMYRMNHNGELSKNMDKLVAQLEKPYYILASGKWPTMWTAIKEAMGTVKSGKFWDELNKAYNDYILQYWSDITLEALVNAGNDITKALEISNLTDLFIPAQTENGKLYFKITHYLETYAETNAKSFFQPNLRTIDIRYSIKTMVRYLGEVIYELFPHFEPTVTKLMKDIDLTPADYGMMKKTKKEIMNIWAVLKDVIEKTN